MHGEVGAWKGPLFVEALDGGEEFDEHLLGNVLGQVLVTGNSVSHPEDGLIVRFIEHSQCLQVPGMALANSLLFLRCASHG